MSKLIFSINFLEISYDVSKVQFSVQSNKSNRYYFSVADATSRCNYSSSGKIFSSLFSDSSRENMEIFLENLLFLTLLIFIVPLRNGYFIDLITLLKIVEILGNTLNIVFIIQPAIQSCFCQTA